MDNGLYLMITPYPGHGLKIKTSSGTIVDTDSIESDSILGEFYSYSEISNKHGVFLILFEEKFPTTCLIRTSTFINFW